MTNLEDKNSLENNEVPKVTPEKIKEKDISQEEFLNWIDNEGNLFKQETREEFNKTNSVELDQPTFEKIKNETGVEEELNILNEEAANSLDTAKKSVFELNTESVQQTRARIETVENSQKLLEKADQIQKAENLDPQEFVRKYPDFFNSSPENEKDVSDQMLKENKNLETYHNSNEIKKPKYEQDAPVAVKRSNGTVEDGWTIGATRLENDKRIVRVFKGESKFGRYADGTLYKDVPEDELDQVNMTDFSIPQSPEDIRKTNELHERVDSLNKPDEIIDLAEESSIKEKPELSDMQVTENGELIKKEEPDLSEKIQDRYKGSLMGELYSERAQELEIAFKDLPEELQSKYADRLHNIFNQEDTVHDYDSLRELELDSLRDYKKDQQFKEFIREIGEAPSTEAYSEILTKAIGNTKSFDDVYKILEVTDGIQGLQERFSAESVRAIVGRIEKGEIGLDSLTSSGELRAKAEELFARVDHTKRSYRTNIQGMNGKNEPIEYQYTIIRPHKEPMQQAHPGFIRLKRNNVWKLVDEATLDNLLNKKSV